MNENVKYHIIPIANLTQEVVDSCMETSIALVRKSLDNPVTLAVVSYWGDCPACLVGIGTEYTYEEVFEEMADPLWTPVE